MTDHILQMRPWFGKEEQRALNEYMEEDGFLTEFKRTEAFENSIAEYTGADECIVVNNGTVSLYLAALACGIEPDDEVIVPNYTMIATPNSIKMVGATPVFVDVEPNTLCMDLSKVEASLTNKTKALMLVLANGRYPKTNIREYQEFCDRYGLSLIEDAAQALGSFYPDGRHMGTVGKVGSFSFSAPKVISTGQGGAIVTNDKEVAAKIRKLKDFGRSGGGADIHDQIGFNFKFTELQACVGLEQMKKLQYRVDRKKEILTRYRDQLSEVSCIEFFEQDLNSTTPWFIDVLVEHRDKLQAKLREDGIGTRVMYPPINAQKAYNIPGSFPVSEKIGKKGLWLPSASQLKNEEIDRVTQAIIEFYE